MNHKIHFVEKFCQFMSFLYYPVPHISFFLSLHWTFETTINILLLMTLPKQFSTALMWLLCWEPLLLCLMAWKKDKDRRKGKGRRICLGGGRIYTLLRYLFYLGRFWRNRWFNRFLSNYSCAIHPIIRHVIYIIR